MRQDAIRVRAAVVRWLAVFSFAVIVVALSFAYLPEFGGSSIVMNVAAEDDADWDLLWSYEWKPRDRDLVHPHRGAALVNGKIIRGTGDDYLISLDAETGKLLWAKQIANPKDGYFISMPPLVHGDLIYIGPAGSEWASSGWIGAFRLSDGEQVWKFNIVPKDG